jgi:hypothetical protein
MPPLKIVAVTVILNIIVAAAAWFATGHFIAGAHP